MRIIIEEHKYAATDVKDVLKGIDALENVEGYVCVNYVGYFYNTDKDVRDCVFILPKVLLEDVDASVMWVLYSSGSSALSGVDSGDLSFSKPFLPCLTPVCSIAIFRNSLFRRLNLMVR